MYRTLTILGLFLAACADRRPPPGSGALETTPTGSAPRPAAPASLSLPSAVPYPNGSVVTTDPTACTVTALRDGTVRWDRKLSGCGGMLEATVALDSVLYVRDPTALSAFEPEGSQRWSTKLPDPPPAAALSAPTALADSRVAIAATSRRVVVYDRDGNVSWSFSPPSDEMLVAPPVGMATEGLVIITSRAVYYLSAEGDTRWRVPAANRTAEL